MKPTGVFYHASFSRRSYLTVGTRLRDFPMAFEPLRSYGNFMLIESPRVSEELVLQVHTRELLEGVRSESLCSTAWHSAGGVVKAVEMVYEGELRNAFAYIGAGGHHAGRNYFWGYCCFNDVVLATRNLRNAYGDVRVAVIDTDAHHGDGTRELVKKDSSFLHYCVCTSSYESPDGLKVDVSYFTTPYHSAVEGFAERLERFEPDILIWYFGHDTHAGDYGDIGLTVEDYRRTARLLKNLAAEFCEEKLVVVLGGGSIPEIARESTLAIIRELLRP